MTSFEPHVLDWREWPAVAAHAWSFRWIPEEAVLFRMGRAVRGFGQTDIQGKDERDSVRLGWWSWLRRRGRKGGWYSFLIWAALSTSYPAVQCPSQKISRENRIWREKNSTTCVNHAIAHDKKIILLSGSNIGERDQNVYTIWLIKYQIVYEQNNIWYFRSLPITTGSTHQRSGKEVVISDERH